MKDIASWSSFGVSNLINRCSHEVLVQNDAEWELTFFFFSYLDDWILKDRTLEGIQGYVWLVTDKLELLCSLWTKQNLSLSL